MVRVGMTAPARTNTGMSLRPYSAVTTLGPCTTVAVAVAVAVVVAVAFVALEVRSICACAWPGADQATQSPAGSHTDRSAPRVSAGSHVESLFLDRPGAPPPTL